MSGLAGWLALQKAAPDSHLQRFKPFTLIQQKGEPRKRGLEEWNDSPNLSEVCSGRGTPCKSGDALVSVPMASVRLTLSPLFPRVKQSACPPVALTLSPCSASSPLALLPDL